MTVPPLTSTLPLLRDVGAALLDLLESLRPEDWTRPTVHAARDVKDLVAHLLDGSLRRLSFQRDGQFLPAPELRSFEDTVAFIQKLNTEWMVAAKRLSPRVLIDLLRRADEEMLAIFAGLDPQAPAPFGVAWAGEEWSPNWFDIAREYTEKWHHQQQIRDAVGKPGLTERRFLYPVLETFLRGAPFAYRHVGAKEGAALRIVITGEAGGTWRLARESGRWELGEGAEGPIHASVSLDADTAWRLWTKGIDRAAARARAHIEGEQALALPLFGMVTIMA
jgi:uncharacterized protein (TIGR03083 family)